MLNKIKKSDFLDLLNIANKIKPIDINYLYNEYCTGNKDLTDLYTKWAASVDAGNPDYDLYNHDLYLNESFNCWRLYARRYLCDMKKYLARPDCEIDVSKINNVLDLGCGCGYSTVALKQMFPAARVMATNLQGTLQYKIDEAITSMEPGIEMHDDSEVFKLGDVDFIFASEFFEHLTEPLAYLDKLITTYHPKYIVYANTFTQMSLGHFRSYEGLFGADVSRHFTTLLRERGYHETEHRFFNSRPRMFML